MNWKKFFGRKEETAFVQLQTDLTEALSKVIELQKHKVRLQKEFDDEVGRLRRELADMQGQLVDVRKKKEMEEREIKHLVRLEKEKNEVENLKERETIKAEYKEKEMALQKEYHGKSMELVERGHEQMKEMYKEIMARLPNVNMAIRQGGPDTVTGERAS